MQRIKDGVVTDDDLESLAIQYKNWKPLAQLLGFLEIESVKFIEDNEAVREQAYAMLIAWKQREGYGATYRVLYAALCHPLVNRQDVAEELCIDDERPFSVST